MKIVLKIFIVLLLGIFLGCTDEVDSADLIKYEDSLIVIYSVISPQDEILKVQVSKSTSLTESELFVSPRELVLKDAQVVLSDADKNEVSLIFSENSLQYEAASENLNIVGGKKYFLNVKVGQKEFTAECVVPKSKVKAIKNELTQINSNDGTLEDVVVTTFEDIKDEENFYIIAGEISSLPLNNLLIYKGQRFATDKIGDKRTIISNGFLSRRTFASYKSETITVQVANVNELLYRYQFSIYLNEVNIEGFFYDNAILPTNINGEGGVGVFSALQLAQENIIIN